MKPRVRIVELASKPVKGCRNSVHPSSCFRIRIIKGPGFRIRHNVRRKWKCPQCGTVMRTQITATSLNCDCRKGTLTWMTLLEEKRAARPMPTPVSKPDPPPERIVSGAEPSPISTMLKPLNLPEADAPTTTTGAVPQVGSESTASPQPGSKTDGDPADKKKGRRSKRRRRGKRTPEADAKGPSDTKPVGDAPAPAASAKPAESDKSPGDSATGGEAAGEKTGRKRKRRRGRRNRKPKD